MDYSCEKCQDTGWVITRKKGREFATKCRCQSEDIFMSKSEKSNLPTRFLTSSLEFYKPDSKNPSQVKAKKVVKKFIDDYPAVSNGLLLQGPTGVGKTRLLCSIATELIKKDPSIDIYYIDWNDMIREMRSGEDFASRDFSAINHMIQKLCRVNLLLLDELGGTEVSQWVYDNIYYLINKRYNNNLVTVCATNFPDDSSDHSLTQRIGQRIRSRLYEMTTAVKMDGTDFRQDYT